ncbi:hypothetical protein [Caulobacter sp. UNC279MFTsu5.1]|uniref:hypothetical protein n=1 Tax=Caulobacter sp. UNC279MFTsu5.1 TaxID=1502775 RepID=UPI0008DFCACC|nr:hypothetical protein [Caulobacter sp. UNC279MFTsu5.1]SFJ06251.1 hypothetical protein SAMN02799626_01065 [Caulobacter sp. UNC279MFTsu5.1]
MSASLRVVTANQRAKVAVETTASLSERVQDLQAEARRLARAHIDALRASLLQTQRIAEEIAGGGEAYPPGVRDIARRLGEDSAARAMTIDGIVSRR